LAAPPALSGVVVSPPSAVTRAPHRTGAVAHGLADILAFQAVIGRTGPAHGDGANHGCRSLRSATGRKDKDERARLRRGVDGHGPGRLVPLAAEPDRSAKRPFCLVSMGVR